MKELQLDLEKLTWNQGRKYISTELASIIDELDPSSRFSLYKAKYTYGDMILKKGDFYLPSQKQGCLIPFKSEEVSNKIKEDLGYNAGSNPVSLVLTNTLELFISLPDRIIPFSIIKPGKIFGLWNVLDKEVSHYPETFLWEMTAGARSIFMLPKISESSANAKLRSLYHISEDKPKKLSEHWLIFHELVANLQSSYSWEVEILFFSKQWFFNTDRAWDKFNNYLLNTAWQSSSYWRNQYIWSLVFSLIHHKKGIKPSPYITDIVKHILSVGMGVLPGFAPATNDNLAPISILQEMYIKDYGLKKYVPIIMQPAYFDFQNQSSPVYLSLQYCTAIELGMKSYDRATTLTNLYHVGGLLTRYVEEILHENLNIAMTPLWKLVKKARFDLFHSNPSHYRNIRKTKHLFLEDGNFRMPLPHYLDESRFPENNTFVNGCIRISEKKD
jgi:hypothetical protein